MAPSHTLSLGLSWLSKISSFFLALLLLSVAPSPYASDRGYVVPLLSEESFQGQLASLIQNESKEGGLIVAYLPKFSGFKFFKELMNAKSNGANVYIVVNKAALVETSPAGESSLQLAKNIIGSGILLSIDYRHAEKCTDGYMVFGHKSFQLLPCGSFDAGSDLTTVAVIDDEESASRIETAWKEHWQHSLRYKTM